MISKFSAVVPRVAPRGGKFWKVFLPGAGITGAGLYGLNKWLEPKASEPKAGDPADATMNLTGTLAGAGLGYGIAHVAGGGGVARLLSALAGGAAGYAAEGAIRSGALDSIFKR